MNRAIQLFGTRFPIIQAGMVWCSGWKLASAVSNAGGLGLIGAGSMHPDILREHIIKCRHATQKSFGVNIPLMYPEIEKIIDIIIQERIGIVFTSAGNPGHWTPVFKRNGIIVVHVVSSLKFALKSISAGVDAIVAEGFEAGGHNGRDETTTFCLVPMIRKYADMPLIAAGGIADGRGMLAAMALGADAVQIGTRFAVSEESSAHINFKNRIVESGEGETMLSMKRISPVRMLKNKFFNELHQAELSGAGIDELKLIIGEKRARRGIFEGNLDEGELEIGQVSAMIDQIKPAAVIVHEIWQEFNQYRKELFYSDISAEG